MCFYLIGTSDYWPKKISQIDVHHIKQTPLNVNDLLEQKNISLSGQKAHAIDARLITLVVKLPSFLRRQLQICQPGGVLAVVINPLCALS